MDRYVAQGSQRESDEQTGANPEPSSAQILAAIEASRLAVQTKIETMALDVNLLGVDLHAVPERSIKTEQHVSALQNELDTLKAMEAALELAIEGYDYWLK
ncbi:hypothetical protein NDU88_000090 [Pleurodeles waltl]|uniref:Uncharacterized protein n=1 Tax=Pleurodeles waltl TaxID=8319 RepID=A0AAV7TE17_PLEWA|nr:hypothetical protein NDU88_000090 [Pleurodeles waltl]